MFFCSMFLGKPNLGDWPTMSIRPLSAPKNRVRRSFRSEKVNSSVSYKDCERLSLGQKHIIKKMKTLK